MVVDLASANEISTTNVQLQFLVESESSVKSPLIHWHKTTSVFILRFQIQIHEHSGTKWQCKVSCKNVGAITYSISHWVVYCFRHPYGLVRSSCSTVFIVCEATHIKEFFVTTIKRWGHNILNRHSIDSWCNKFFINTCLWVIYRIKYWQIFFFGLCAVLKCWQFRKHIWVIYNPWVIFSNGSWPHFKIIQRVPPLNLHSLLTPLTLRFTSQIKCALNAIKWNNGQLHDRKTNMQTNNRGDNSETSFLYLLV